MAKIISTIKIFNKIRIIIVIFVVDTRRFRKKICIINILKTDNRRKHG